MLVASWTLTSLERGSSFLISSSTAHSLLCRLAQVQTLWSRQLLSRQRRRSTLRPTPWIQIMCFSLVWIAAVSSRVPWCDNLDGQESGYRTLRVAPETERRHKSE